MRAYKNRSSGLFTLSFVTLGLAGLLSSLLSIGLNNQAYAAVIPSPDGQNHLLVTVSDKKTSYQVTATNSQKTYNLAYKASEKGYYSPALIGSTGADCIGPGASSIRAINTFNISVKVGGKVAGSDSFSFCGKGLGFIQTTSVQVSTPQDPASFSGCISYKDDQGKTQTFKKEASGKLDGPGSKSYNLDFNDSGCVNKISNLPPGNYSVKADYLPPLIANQHFEQSIKLSAGEDFKLSGVVGQPAAGGETAEAKDACKDYAPGGSLHNNTYYHTCLDGFAAGAAGKTRKQACENGFVSGSASQDACLVGFKAATSDGGDDTSACIANSHTSLEWFMCPLITAISDGADGLNKFVEDQLDFSINNFLPDSGPNDGVYKAWTVIKDLASSVLIIVLLIMVFSQALGTGVFEAYTVRKILPRLVIAVITMQLSWELCIFIINFINHLGEGLAQLMTAPFGGRGNLDLGSLLNHLSGFWAGATEVSLTAALVAGGFLSAVFLPGALLVAFSVLLTVLIGLASILFRNIIIIACVIFSPLALLLWVIPNQSTKKYWNLWSDNFTKVLLLFPIMVGIIYGGRIFAYIAGGLSSPGFLDLIMVLVGFFGPYAILPKAFKWGGSLMSSGANAIATNAAVRKSREVGKKEFGDWQKRRIGEQAKKFDPSHPDYVKWKKGRFGLPAVASGKVGSTVLQNLRSGRVIPTKRSMATTIQKGDEWNSQEDAIAAAKLKREQDKAIANPNRVEAYSLDTDGKTVKIKTDLDNPTAAGKMAIMRAMGSADDREAGVAVEQFLKTSSWVEAGNNLVPVEDPGLIQRLRNSDAETFDDPEGKGRVFVRAYEIPRWSSKINSSPDLYPLPLGKWTMSTPHIVAGHHEQGLNRDLPAEYAQEQQEENAVAQQEGRQPRQIAFKPLNRQQGRAVATMRDYINAENINNQSESEIREFNRLAGQNPVVADEFAKLLGRIGEGGQEGVNVIGRLASSESTRGAVNDLLARANIKTVDDKGKTIDLTTGRIQTNAQARLQGNVTNQGQETATSVTAQPAQAGTQTTGTPAAAGGGSQGGQGTAPAGGGTPSAGGGGAGAAGGGAPGGTHTPNFEGPTLGKTELKQAFKEALDESSLGQRPSAMPGELIIPHGPETRGTGAQFEDSQFYKPQERRTRPPEEPPTPPAGS